MDLDFLDEVSAFLDPDSLPTVTTPRNSTGDEDYQLILSRTNFESWGTVDSSSEDVEPESSKSSSSENEKKSSVPKQNNRQEVGDNRRKRYRERVKYERKELKKLERELTLQVRELIDSRESKKTTARTDLSLSKSFWRDLAFQQHELRTKSEADQKQLIAAIQSQASYIDNLKNVFCVQPSSYVGAEDLAKVSVQPMGNLKWLRMKSSNAVLYEIYIKEIQDNYERVDQVFEECGMDSMSIGSASSLHRNNSATDADYIQYMHKLLQPFSFEVDEIMREFDLVNNRNGVTSSICYRQEDREIEYFQHLNRYTEPCNYEKTHETTWKLFKLLHRQQDRQEFNGLGSQDDTIVLQFRLVRTLGSGVAVSVLQRYVVRRFMETNRTVFVWKTLSEGEGLFTGMHAEESGWVCLQPSEEDSTFMRICVRQAPMQFGQLSLSDASVSEFHQVLLSSVGEDTIEISTALDKMLLDDTLKGIDI